MKPHTKFHPDCPLIIFLVAQITLENMFMLKLLPNFVNDDQPGNLRHTKFQPVQKSGLAVKRSYAYTHEALLLLLLTIYDVSYLVKG